MEHLTMDMEYASHPRGFRQYQEGDFRRAIRNAPRWWLERAGLLTAPLASATARRRPPAKPAGQQAKPVPVKRYAGWIAGCCAPGVSVPAYSSRDGQQIPEQFTPNALDSILRQVQKQGVRASLTWGHNGPVLATGPLDFTLRVHPIYGLEFRARLTDSTLARQVIQAAATGLGCSIGFVPVRQWTIDREGVGPVRVVDDCKLDHLAILPPEKKQRPAYAGARCFGSPQGTLWCPGDLMEKAERQVWPLLTKQAGARS